MDIDSAAGTADSVGGGVLRELRGTGPSLTSSISNAVVRLYAEHVGRGPTKARTVISRNLVTVVLEDTFTRGDRSLLDAGERETVLRTRRAYQRALREPLKDTIERLTSRTVIAVLSDHQDDPDIAIENFVLEAEPTEEARFGRGNSQRPATASSDGHPGGGQPSSPSRGA